MPSDDVSRMNVEDLRVSVLEDARAYGDLRIIAFERGRGVPLFTSAALNELARRATAPAATGEPGIAEFRLKDDGTHEIVGVKLTEAESANAQRFYTMLHDANDPYALDRTIEAIIASRASPSSLPAIPESALVSPGNIAVSEWDVDDEACTMKTKGKDVAGIRVYLVRADAVQVTPFPPNKPYPQREGT